MSSINIICERGNLSIDLIHDDGVRLVDVQGLGAEAVIGLVGIPGYDGETITSNVVAKRPITFILRFRGGNVEAHKYRIYSIFKLKQTGTLTFVSEHRTVKIDYVVEKCNIPLNLHPLRAEISLLCPQPYFESLTEIQSYIAQIVPLWEFSFEIDDEVGFEFSEISQSLIANVPNNGEVDTGCVFVFYATGNCKNPKIENINTHEWMQVGISGGSLELNMVAGDVLKIDTRTGQKAIAYIHNGVEQNYINYKVYGSKFLQLAVGDNEFRYSAEENERNLEITVYYTEKFGGV